MFRSLLIVFILSCALCLASEDGNGISTFQFAGEYSLVSESEACTDLEFNDIQIKIFSDEKNPLSLTIYPDVEYQEMNIPISYNKKEKAYCFENKDISSCEDGDCYGISAVNGCLEERHGVNGGYFVNMVISFYKDTTNYDEETISEELKEWDETVEFKLKKYYY